jgi:polysaccharide pyruvyl transferase WcaK-like protein
MLRPGFSDKLRKGGRTLLWGWAPCAEVLSRTMVRRLGRCHGIIVSDQKSVELLAAAGLRKNVRLGPDPAFLVKRQLRPLQGSFRQDTIGLCFSPAAGCFEQEQGLLYRSYCHLIRWVLDNTAWQIALIPYCVKPCCNDETLLTILERQFGQTERMVCRGDGDCRVLRGDLSMCRCCVGTAGALAAWSCGVPGLCVGSSARARSLSWALFGTIDTVVRAGSLRSDNDLTDRFRAFLRQEDTLRRRLERTVAQHRRWAADWKWQDAV